MKLTKSTGNMYPWVTHMLAHIGGECPHRCKYCYVPNSVSAKSGKFKGEPHIIEGSLDVNMGSGNVIFIDHMNDLWAEGVSDEMVRDVLIHCWKYPKNQYVFQTKNPERYTEFELLIPKNSLLGCTIESTESYWDDVSPMSHAPSPLLRMYQMAAIDKYKTFITIEPILDLNVSRMLAWLSDIHPSFVNIGADSKGHNLPEPNWEKVEELIAGIKRIGIEIREKHNLDRLREKSNEVNIGGQK